MKGMMFSCLYEVDDEKFAFTAFNHEGQLFGFVNPPVRDYRNLEWVDSATGDPGELIPYAKWDTSMREPKDFTDMHTKNIPALKIERMRKKKNALPKQIILFRH